MAGLALPSGSACPRRTAPHSSKEVCHGRNTFRPFPPPRALEQGQAVWTEGTLEAEGHLGDAVRLQQEHRTRELAPLNLGIDSKLRACDLVSLRVRDITHGDHVANQAIVQQKKTGRPVQFGVDCIPRTVTG
jgi:hypothetical protein